jgi:hypothetical protein
MNFFGRSFGSSVIFTSLWRATRDDLTTRLKNVLFLRQLKPRPNRLQGGWKPTYPTSIRTSTKAVSLVPRGEVKTNVRRENTDVRWVGLHLLQRGAQKLTKKNLGQVFNSECGRARPSFKLTTPNQ